MAPTTEDCDVAGYYHDEDGDDKEELLHLMKKQNKNNRGVVIQTLETWDDHKRQWEGLCPYHFFFFSLAVNFILAILLFVLRHGDSSNAALMSTQVVDRGRNSTQHGWVRPDVIYGLVHMAKTAGTEINGELANHYERVCGNKGYSYDALENNKRFSSIGADPEKTMSRYKIDDSVNKLNHGTWNRGRVPDKLMAEIGYDDCDYIAMEIGGAQWRQFSRRWKMELHVPCRDPLQHLMSQCNYRDETFDCNNETNLEQEVDKCVMGMHRFHHRLETDPNVTLRCFNPVPPKRYAEYMGNILQRKRIESEYVHRATNSARHKDEECLWKQGPEFQDRVRNIMIQTYPFYAYCDKCMGSAKELPLP